MKISLEWVKVNLERMGFVVTNGVSENAEAGLAATLNTENGIISVLVTERGARVAKPNGSHKYYYEVTGPRLAQYIQQAVKANGGRKEGR